MTDELHGSDERLAATLAELRALGTGQAPAPSAALAALFGSNDGIDEFSGRRRLRDRRGLVAGIAVAGASATLALSGVAAAHDALPGPAEGVISGIVNSVTPFHIDSDDPVPARPNDVVVPTGGQPTPGTTGDTGDRRRGGGSGGSDDGSGSGDGGSGSGSSDGEGGSGSGSGSGSDSDSGSDSGSGSGGSGDGSAGGSGSGSDTSGSGGSGSGSGGSGSGSGDSGSGDSGSGGSGSTASSSPTSGSDGSGSGSGGGGSGSGSGSDG
jgi:hypothetical protein